MMTLEILLIYILATWRVSSLLVGERGPWDIFLRLRETTGIEHGEDGKPTIIPDGFFSELFSCVWCTSVWVGIFWTLVASLCPFGEWLGLPFALSAAAIWMEERWQK